MSVGLLAYLQLIGCVYGHAVITIRVGRPGLLLLSSFRLKVAFKREAPDSIPSCHAYVSVSPQGLQKHAEIS